MNKMTKGAIAAAAGVILLMGGAGTLASWNSAASLDAAGNASISSGTLKVDTANNGTWKSNGSTITPGSVLMVPGDVYTYTQTFNITASGNNLLFKVATTPATYTAGSAGANSALTAVLTANTTFNVSSVTTTGSNIVATGVTANTFKLTSNTTSTPATVVVTMTVTFPYGTVVDNTTQGGTATLTGGAVTLTQTQTA